MKISKLRRTTAARQSIGSALRTSTHPLANDGTPKDEHEVDAVPLHQCLRDRRACVDSLEQTEIRQTTLHHKLHDSKPQATHVVSEIQNARHGASLLCRSGSTAEQPCGSALNTSARVVRALYALRPSTAGSNVPGTTSGLQRSSLQWTHCGCPMRSRLRKCWPLVHSLT